MTKKRRTKKQKLKAKHQFTVSWGETRKNTKNNILVKGQSNSDKNKNVSRMKHSNKAENKAEVTSLASTKRNLIKSLIVASLILSLEVMLYLATR